MPPMQVIYYPLRTTFHQHDICTLCVQYIALLLPSMSSVSGIHCPSCILHKSLSLYPAFKPNSALFTRSSLAVFAQTSHQFQWHCSLVRQTVQPLPFNRVQVSPGYVFAQSARAVHVVIFTWYKIFKVCIYKHVTASGYNVGLQYDDLGLNTLTRCYQSTTSSPAVAEKEPIVRRCV